MKEIFCKDVSAERRVAFKGLYWESVDHFDGAPFGG
jgi:hypothetical protein